MKRNSFIALLVTGIIAVGVFTSCSTPVKSSAQNASRETYKMGVYSAILSCNLYDADKAVRATGVKARFIEVSRRNMYNHIEYTFRDLYDNKLTITIWTVKTDSNQTKIQISVGKTGDKKSSQEILEAIDDELRMNTGFQKE